MASEWPEVRLGALGEFRNGVNFSRDDYGPGFPIVNVKQLYGGRYADVGELLEVRRLAVSNPDAVRLQYGDILFARSSVKASGAGQVVMVGPCPRDAVFSGFIIRFRVTERSRVIPEYLNYLLRSPMYRELLARIGGGTSITNLGQETLAALPIRLPSLSEQRVIVRVLGALDDEIDLNKRMSGTLEAVARALFKSWFVDLNPVSDNPEVRDLGLEGWPIGKVGDLACRVLERVDEPASWHAEPLINLARMPQRSIALAEWGVGSELTTSVTRFRRGDTLFGAIRPYFHKVGLAPVDGVTNVSVFVIRAMDDADSPFVALLCSTVDVVEHATRVARGTKMPVVSWADFEKYEFSMPPAEVRAAFGRLVGPMLDRIVATVGESRNVAAVRNTLIPKLVSGQLRVAGDSVSAGSAR